MSLDGNAKANSVLRGNVSMPDTLHGKSAYEIAVINGFSGTEAEWLESLKGEKGDPYTLSDTDKQEIADTVYEKFVDVAVDGQ